MEDVIEQIYDAALDSGKWGRVTELLNEIFASKTSALYSLNFDNNCYQSFHISGVNDSFLSEFKELYFTRDNPWLKSEPLHEPGIIRTDTHLSHYLKDNKILHNSTYYNEWLKPQQLNHSLGCTLSANKSMKTNLTLFRPSDVGVFTQSEVSKFKIICRHLHRAFNTATRLESFNLTAQLADEAMRQLSCATIVLNNMGKVININDYGMTLLKKQNFLTVVNDQICASEVIANNNLKQFIMLGDHTIENKMRLVFKENITFSLTLVDLCKGVSPLVSAESVPTKLLLVKEIPADFKLSIQQYDLSPSEVQLTKFLCSGLNLKKSAETLNITYETARSYLKIIFQKTETHKQIDLIRLFFDTSLE